MDFVGKPWGAAMGGIFFLATDLVGVPLPVALVGDIRINVGLPALDFLAQPT